MIQLPTKLMVTKIPRLNDEGKAFYKDELRGYINKLVNVEGISWHRGEVNHVVVELKKTDEVTVLFPWYFVDDIIVEEIS